MTARIGRRDFITLLGGAAAWPFLAQAQGERARRVGVLMSTAVDDPQDPARLAAFAEGLQELGWTIGRNLRIDYRWGASSFARGSNGGLILIIGLAAQHRLPAVYFNRLFVEAGGLISYGADTVDPLRRAANYVDRILRGEKPADLPVQAPTKYELVINLKTAKALGLELPPTVLARADEVIE